MKTKYEEIVNVERIGEKGVTDISGVLSLAKRERIRTASQDKVKRMLLCRHTERFYGRRYCTCTKF